MKDGEELDKKKINITLEQANAAVAVGDISIFLKVAAPKRPRIAVVHATKDRSCDPRVEVPATEDPLLLFAA